MAKKSLIDEETFKKLDYLLEKSDKIIKLLAWGSGSILIFETSRKARQLPIVQGAGSIASWLEEVFLGKPLAPAPVDWTAEDELRANIEWALASMLGSYVIVEHGGDIIRGLIPGI